MTEMDSSTVPEAGSLRSRCQQASAHSHGSRGDSVPSFSLCFWQCYGPGHYLVCRCITPVSASIISGPSPCVSLWTPSSFHVWLVVLSHFSCVWLFETPVDHSLPGFSVQGILQARILEWVAITSSRASSWPRDGNWVSCIAGGFFNICATREDNVGLGPTLMTSS